MRRAARTASIITVALCIPLVPFFIIGELPGDRWLSSRDEHAIAFALAGAGLLAVDVLLPIPSSIVGTMLGARLGAAMGFLAAFGGMMAGQSLAFAASRRIMSRRSAALPAAPTLAVVFLSRPVPVLAEAMAISAGAAGLGWRPFLIACGSGNALYAGALALNGAEWLPDRLLGPGLLLPMLLPVVGWLAWRATRRENSGHGG
jgi:uncharacterized membrane protein YdjX (TVP38/TMEM64 family)